MILVWGKRTPNMTKELCGSPSQCLKMLLHIREQKREIAAMVIMGVSNSDIRDSGQTLSAYVDRDGPGFSLDGVSSPKALSISPCLTELLLLCIVNPRHNIGRKKDSRSMTQQERIQQSNGSSRRAHRIHRRKLDILKVAARSRRSFNAFSSACRRTSHRTWNLKCDSTT